MLEQMAKHRSQSVSASNNNSKPRQFATTAAIDSNSQVDPCAFCSEPHLRQSCPLSRSDRLEALKRQNKCFGCFKSLRELPSDHRGNCATSCKACRRRSMNTQVCPCPNQRHSSHSITQSDPPIPPASNGEEDGHNTGSAETRSSPSAHQDPSRVGGASKGPPIARNQEVIDTSLATHVCAKNKIGRAHV